MNEIRNFVVEGEDCSVDVMEMLQGVHEMLSGIGHCMESIAIPNPEEEPLMIVVVPGAPMQLVTPEECNRYLPCFGESDMIIEAPDTALLFSCNEAELLVSEDGDKYLVGTAIIYDVDEDGFEVPMTVRDVYAVQQMLEKRSCILSKGGKQIPAIKLT